MIHINDFKSILCLNGELPDPKIFPYTLPIIAADGAVNRLGAFGMMPEVIIGDLDSIDKSKYKYITCIEIADQNSTDFEKALEYVTANSLNPTLILGVSGGFLDHILNNINIILKYKCTFYAPPIWGYTLEAPISMILKLPFGTKTSLLGMPAARIKTTGLKWELDTTLTFPGYNSCLNRVASHDGVNINLSSGVLLLLIYDKTENDKGMLACLTT